MIPTPYQLLLPAHFFSFHYLFLFPHFPVFLSWCYEGDWALILLQEEFRMGGLHPTTFPASISILKRKKYINEKLTILGIKFKKKICKISEMLLTKASSERDHIQMKIKKRIRFILLKQGKICDIYNVNYYKSQANRFITIWKHTNFPLRQSTLIVMTQLLGECTFSSFNKYTYHVPDTVLSNLCLLLKTNPHRSSWRKKLSPPSHRLALHMINSRCLSMAQY